MTAELIVFGRTKTNNGQKTDRETDTPTHTHRDVGQGHAGHAMACPVVGTLKLSGHQSREEEEKKRKKEKEKEKENDKKEEG